jgi:hypothetical protein
MRTQTFTWLTGGITGLLLATAAAVTAQEGSTSKATVLQIMEQTVVPESTAIFDIAEPPKAAAEWTAARTHAVAIARTGELMLSPANSPDKGEWVAQVQAYVDAGNRLARAADAKNFDAFLEASDALAETCVNCHAKYLEKK